MFTLKHALHLTHSFSVKSITLLQFVFYSTLYILLNIKKKGSACLLSNWRAILLRSLNTWELLSCKWTHVNFTNLWFWNRVCMRFELSTHRNSPHSPHTFELQVPVSPWSPYQLNSCKVSCFPSTQTEMAKKRPYHHCRNTILARRSHCLSTPQGYTERWIC